MFRLKHACGCGCIHELVIEFQYRPVFFRTKEGIQKTVACDCYMVEVEGKETWNTTKDAILAASVTHFSGDTFDKNIARKNALAKLLDMYTDDREVRGIFWEAYFAARKGVK
jgi:hypothetical protein